MDLGTLEGGKLLLCPPYPWFVRDAEVVEDGCVLVAAHRQGWGVFREQH